MKQFFARINLYWACQLLGWGSAAIYWAYYQVYGNYSVFMGVASVIWTFLISIGATHVYHNLAHRWGWTRMDLVDLIPRLVLAWVVLVVCYFVSGGISVYLRMYEMTFPTFLGMLAGGIRYMAIWLLAFHLYHFARYSRQHEIDQSELDRLAITAQLNRLNAELNPHFLFNSLNSIKALTLEDPSKARKALDLLSDLLRASLRVSNQQLIPLAEEMSRIKTYLELEKIRFEERLQYEINIPEELNTQMIPPLSYYNLVENAVKHGISQSTDGGDIRIYTVVENEELQLIVVNDGVLEEKNQIGIGLENVRQRLKLSYGNLANLGLKQLSGNQVEAKVCIPI